MPVIRMEIKLQPQFILSICFHFTQKSKQAFYSGLALKSLPKKTLLQVSFFVFFLSFHFLRYLKALYINYTVVCKSIGPPQSQ